MAFWKRKMISKSLLALFVLLFSLPVFASYWDDTSTYASYDEFNDSLDAGIWTVGHSGGSQDFSTNSGDLLCSSGTIIAWAISSGNQAGVINGNFMGVNFTYQITSLSLDGDGNVLGNFLTHGANYQVPHGYMMLRIYQDTPEISGYGTLNQITGQVASNVAGEPFQNISIYWVDADTADIYWNDTYFHQVSGFSANALSALRFDCMGGGGAPTAYRVNWIRTQVAGIAENTAPNFDSIADFSLDEDFGVLNMNLSLNVSDVEDSQASLSFNWTVNDTGILSLDVDNVTGDANFTSVANASGLVEVIISVVDTGDLSNSTSFIIDVNPVNDILWVDLDLPADNQVNKSSNMIDFTFVPNDVEGIDNCSLVINEVVNLSYSAITLNSVNNLTVFLYNDDYNWNVNCTDSDNVEVASAIRNISVRFNFVPIFDSIGNVTKNANFPKFIIDLKGYVSDVEDEDSLLVYNWTLSDDSVFSLDIDNVTGIATFSSTVNGSGDVVVLITVIDSDELSNFSEFTVIVNPVNDEWSYYVLPFFVIITGIFFFLGYYLRDFVFKMLAGFLIILVGIYTYLNGLYGINNLLFVDTTILVLLGLGIYLVSSSGYDWIVEAYGG